jgi:AbrB family looped-hinge helix DNA binding protein
MRRVRMSRDGRITLPKAIRDARGWRVGTIFLVEEREGGLVLHPQRRPTFDEILGFFHGGEEVKRIMKGASSLNGDESAGRGGKEPTPLR